jgi:hypothetical protein
MIFLIRRKSRFSRRKKIEGNSDLTRRKKIEENRVFHDKK